MTIEREILLAIPSNICNSLCVCFFSFAQSLHVFSTGITVHSFVTRDIRDMVKVFDVAFSFLVRPVIAIYTRTDLDEQCNDRIDITYHKIVYIVGVNQMNVL